MKHAFSLLIVIFIAVVVAGQADHASKDKKSALQKEGQTAVTVVHDEAPNEHAEKTAPNSPERYAALKQPEWWLVVVGAFTFLAIWYQAKKTAIVTGAMERSAKATEDYITAFMATQRPQLAIAPDNPIPDVNAGKPVKIRVEITNKGLSPAYSCVYESWVEIIPEPFIDFTPRAVYFRLPTPMTIYTDAPPLPLLRLG